MRDTTDGRRVRRHGSRSQAAFGREVVQSGSGGSIPLVPVLAATFPDAEILICGASDEKSAVPLDRRERGPRRARTLLSGRGPAVRRARAGLSRGVFRPALLVSTRWMPPRPPTCLRRRRRPPYRRSSKRPNTKRSRSRRSSFASRRWSASCWRRPARRRWTSPGATGSVEIYQRAVGELEDVLSPDLQEELSSLAPPMQGVPTDAEIRVAQAQLVGWLEGLFHGIQAAMFAQQMAARAQFEELRRRGLPGQDRRTSRRPAGRTSPRRPVPLAPPALQAPPTIASGTPTARRAHCPPPPAIRCAT